MLATLTGVECPSVELGSLKVLEEDFGNVQTFPFLRPPVLSVAMFDSDCRKEVNLSTLSA